MLVYDIEIARCVPPRKGPMDPELEYCKGWDDHKGMGISSICSYDDSTSTYNVFMKDNMDRFDRLLRRRLGGGEQIVGFNNRLFDNLVLHANGMVTDLAQLQKHSYDLLQEIWRAVTGIQEYVEDFHWKIHADYGLDAMCEANYLENKVGLGVQAPIDFQQGNYGMLIDYNLQDVKLTRDLYRLAYMSQGRLKTPKGGTIVLRSPEEVLHDG